jgi:hypothetical protein
MKISSLVTVATVLATGLASNVTIVRPNEPFVQPSNNLPESHASSDGGEIVQLFANLGRSTVWKLVQTTRFEGDIGEPEGMARIGDNRYFVSAGQWTVPTEKYSQPINGTDRTPGAGFAHMLIYDAQGRLIANATLTEPGDIEYHPGGIDYDGRYIWATLSQYRPNTTATIVQIDPLNLKQKKLFHARDHNGGIVHDTVANDLFTLNWGGRNTTKWSLTGYPRNFAPLPAFTPPLSSVPDSSHFIDYQDCKFLGHHSLPNVMTAHSDAPESTKSVKRPIMFCGGVATIGSSSSFSLGGIALVDLQTMQPIWEVPIAMTSELGSPVTQNPIDIAVVDGKLRIYCLPDLHNATLYVFEAV